MKRKRTLIAFGLAWGYNGDDFVQARVSVVITYLLKGQTRRRRWLMGMPEVYLQDLKTARGLIWRTFKADLNIKD